MANTTSTDYGSTPGEPHSPAEKSPQKSKKNAASGAARDATKKAGKKPQDSEVRLSILQTAFEQWLEAGGAAGIGSSYGEIRLHLYGVSRCGNCRFWSGQESCPICGNSQSGQMPQLPQSLIPVVWQFGDVEIHAVAQPDGARKFAIRRDGEELGKDGEWEMPPFPSNRPADYLATHRWDTLADAVNAAQEKRK